MYDESSKQFVFVSLGQQVCDAIVKVQSSSSIISTLIDFLTIEARSFSSQTIKTIKIVEMSSGPVLLASHHQPPPPPPPKAPQSVVLITTNQTTQSHPTYATEHSEMNKTNIRYVLQQHVKPLTITDIIPSGNILSIATPPTNTNEKKRKHDSKSSGFYFQRFHQIHMSSYFRCNSFCDS